MERSKGGSLTATLLTYYRSVRPSGLSGSSVHARNRPKLPIWVINKVVAPAVILALVSYGREEGEDEGREEEKNHTSLSRIWCRRGASSPTRQFSDQVTHWNWTDHFVSSLLGLFVNKRAVCFLIPPSTSCRCVCDFTMTERREYFRI